MRRVAIFLVLVSPFKLTGHAQRCYEFKAFTHDPNQPPLVLTVNIQTLPPPKDWHNPIGGGNSPPGPSNGTMYDLLSVPGNSATLTVGTVYSEVIEKPPIFRVSITNYTTYSLVNFLLALHGGLQAVLVGPPGLFPDSLPPTLPPVSSYTHASIVLNGTPAREYYSLDSAPLDSVSGCTETQQCEPPRSDDLHGNLYPQDQGNWCWAAATEMLMDNATGHNNQYEQCNIVNQVLRQGEENGRPYCCAHEDKCNKQRTLLEGLGVFNYECTNAGAGLWGTGFLRIARKAIMQEISCRKRMIAFMWSQPGTKHEMIIYAYNDSEKGLILSVYDPQAAVYPHQYTFPISYDDLLNPHDSTDEHINRFDKLLGLCYDIHQIQKGE
jgi:hypothetical protein